MKFICRNLCPPCFSARRAHRSYPYNGNYAPAFERSSHPCAADAQSLASGVGTSSPFQHQSNGCSHPAVLHDGRGSGRGAIGGRRIHRSCAHHGRGHQSVACRIYVRTTFVDQRSVLHRRDFEDCLRSASLPFVSAIAPSGRGVVGTAFVSTPSSPLAEVTESGTPPFFCFPFPWTASR